MSSMARRFAMHHAASFVLPCSSHGLKTPLRLTITARVAKSLPEDYKSDRLRSPLVRSLSANSKNSSFKTDWTVVWRLGWPVSFKNRFDNISFYDIDYCLDKTERRDPLSTHFSSLAPGVELLMPQTIAHATIEHRDHGKPHELSFFGKYIWAEDHKTIAIQYLFACLFFLCVGGLLAMGVRYQLKGSEAPKNPWSATTLEWTVPSPPGHGNFEKTPIVYHGPYEYSVPGMEQDFLPQDQPAPETELVVAP
jgi:hypothetical protein